MREWLVKISYELEMNPEIAMDINKIFNNHGLSEKNEYLITSLESLIDNGREIDKAIADNLKSWKIDRLHSVDRAILRVSFNEILYTKLAPESVTINESVEIAKKYSSENSYQFINGVLSGLIKGLKES